MNSDQQKRIGLATLLVLAVVFIVAIMASNALLRGVRVDLTQNRLYTLSDGTRSLLSGLDQPINLYYFFSDRETGEAQFLRDYATRVQEMLEEFADRANGNINLNVIDPVPFSVGFLMVSNSRAIMRRSLRLFCVLHSALQRWHLLQR